MDTTLVVAQMQGKFKLVCFNSDVGHSMHEDSPKEAADELLKVLKRFKIPLDRAQSNRIKEVGFGVFKNGL
jgi:adenine C2-methylase RlmN of 23S rRNA A2503 and tRNA A37